MDSPAILEAMPPNGDRADKKLNDLGILDPIHFVGAILQRHRATGVHLTTDQWESLEQFLLMHLCRMAAKTYKPNPTTSLSTYAHNYLPKRINDWYREELPTRRYKETFTFSTLTDQIPDSESDWTTNAEFHATIGR